ncbi:hypothetical protein ABT095_25065 [Kitasatospora sp. NPDC002227]|uniref:hypothetical protein n=1 Tax=Kitasatospora sp. NPDC002227 TaxID=3154773 RepID=UPI003325C2E6
MSVLSVPRVLFRGKASWNPAAGNNNDQWPVYDFPNAVLNRSCLQSPDIGITPENVREEFPRWARIRHWYNSDPSDPTIGRWQPPGEWNYYGGMESRSRGSLELHYASGLGKSVALLTERTVSMNTDDRSIFLDQGRSGTVALQVRERGAGLG